MNSLEMKMVEVLPRLTEDSAVSIKVEHKVKGTRMDELLPLVDAARDKYINFIVKIGSREAKLS